MDIASATRVALAALLANRLRFALTSLGIIIGIGAVIAMVAAGTGARSKLDERLASVGVHLILVRPGARTESGTMAEYAPLKKEDADAIRKEAAPWLQGVAPTQVSPRTVTASSRNWATTMVGTTAEFAPVCNWRMRAGHFLTNDDNLHMANVCVIGETVRSKLFPDRSNPVGETLQLEHLQLQIVGLFAPKGRNPLGVDQDDSVTMPLSTLQHKLVGNENLGLILSSARSDQLIDQARAVITRILRQRHHLRPKAANDFDVSSVQEMSQIAVVMTRTMQVLIAIIASISLIVGGIGIMNIMLVSVTERTREIGIRMAVGATPGDVLVQFLVEAIVLALVGGLLGITLGIAGAVGLAYLAEWPIVLSPAVVALDFGISAAVGVFFGFYPALKASQLDPIEALRYE